MATTGHAPEWPDKIMAAGLFVLLGGLVAMLHAGLHFAGASFDQDSNNILAFIPPTWTLVMGMVGAVAGFFGYLHQSWLLVVFGIVFDFLSFGLLGTSSLIALLAIWPLVRSFQEGEETRLDRHHVRAHEWPDKAIMASVVMVAAGAVTLMHGALVWMDRMTAPILPGSPLLWGGIAVAAGVLAIAAGREVFKLRRAWLGWTAAGVLLLSAGFYAIGPALALAAIIYMALAQREAEFLLHQPDDEALV